MTTTGPLLQLPNHHQEAPALPELTEDHYVGYFANRHGEQLIFVATRGQAIATLYHGDADWKPYPVGAPLSAEEQRLRDQLAGTPFGQGINPILGDLILSGDENLWLDACWKASKHWRST